MKRAALLGAAILLTVILAGCGGDFLSPTATDYETTTTAAELTQEHNRPLCVGLLNLGSCNTVAVQTQPSNRPAASPAAADMPDVWGMILTTFALLAAFGVALFLGMLLTGDRGYNA